MKVDSQDLQMEGAQNICHCPHLELSQSLPPQHLCDSFQGGFLGEVTKWVGLVHCKTGKEGI